jgi:hypothetical protein
MRVLSSSGSTLGALGAALSTSGSALGALGVALSASGSALGALGDVAAVHVALGVSLRVASS